MKQPRAKDLDGIKEMYPEIEIIGITFPVMSEDGVLNVMSFGNKYSVDRMIALAARTCYQTEGAGEEKDYNLIKNVLIKNAHLSVLEHAQVVIKVRGCSRALTHQLVRHRHTAFSQESQRYCDEGNFGYVIPPRIKGSGFADRYVEMVTEARNNYMELQALLSSAGYGREANEDARFLLPNAVASEIVIGVNFTELRHMFMKRLTTHAQWEIRQLFTMILGEMICHTCCFDDINDYLEEHGSLNGFTMVF
jgi:flavin-dependent thymidylate synthase